MESQSRLGHGIITLGHMLAQLRCFWFWLFILWIPFGLVLVKFKCILPPELYWTVFGLFLGILFTKAFDESPVFVREYDDPTYMLENNLFRFKSRILKDRIFVSLFGVSRDKMIVVYPFVIRLIKLKLFSCSPFEITLDDSEIIKQIDRNTQFLKLANSDLIYAFSDFETYQRFLLWAKSRGHTPQKSEVDENKLKKHRLGCVLTSAYLWTDSDIINRTNVLASPTKRCT